MNNQKFFLIIAIALSIFLLWDKWQIKHNAPSAANNILIENNASIATTKVADDLPDINIDNIQSDNQNLPIVNNINYANNIKINTDLLSLEISNKGATILYTELNHYPQEIGSKKNFVLLNDKADDYFVMQSGLLPKDIMPTHNAIFTTDKNNYNLIDDTLTVPFMWEQNGIKIIKTFSFRRGSYLIDVNYKIFNNSNKNITIVSYSQLARHKLEQHSVLMPTFSGGAVYNDKDVYEKIKFTDFTKNNIVNSKGGWAALVEHYFLAAIIPNQQQNNKFSTRVVGDKYILSSVSSSSIIVAKNSNIELSAGKFYLGAKEKQKLATAFKGLEYTVDYSWLYIIAKPLSELLHFIFSLVGNWGLTIIMLTILIKLAFYKLSEKSYKSMAKMRKLAPRLEKLKERYGDDKQKMGQKTMQLYKEAKVNPASGCLPILVQMPVFIALYWVLIETVEFRHTAFLYLPDLSAPDPYYILPVIMGVSMYIQQKLNPKPADPIQAKIMTALPVVFSIFFLWFPSGLVLYWVINNTLSILQQRLIIKRIDKADK